MIMKKQPTAIVVLVVFLLTMLTGCGAPNTPAEEPGDAYPASHPDKLYENSSYPGVTFNETTLVFIEEMFTSSIVSVYSNETGETYTIADEANRDEFGDTCEYYLNEDVIASIRDDWQTESWNYLEGATFKSSQPQVIFTDTVSGNYLQFWLQAKLVGVKTTNTYMIYNIPDEAVAALQRQHVELPTATSTRRTAEETVAAFFDALNAGDAEAYNELVCAQVENPAIDPNVTDVLTSTKNLGHIGDFPAEWYAAPYANRIVVAKFDRTTVTKGGLFGSDAKATESMRWEFYLVRESADAEWKIAAYGAA